MEENSIFATVLIIGGISLILMVIFFAGGTLLNQTDSSETELFTTTTQFEDKACELNHVPASINSVEYYNGASWTTLTSSDYTLSGNTVTVDASAMD